VKYNKKKKKKMIIKLNRDVVLPRFTLYKGETWDYKGNLSRQSKDAEGGFLTIGGGRVYKEDYKILKR